jgi:hypothetical protein
MIKPPVAPQQIGEVLAPIRLLKDDAAEILFSLWFSIRHNNH